MKSIPSADTSKPPRLRVELKDVTQKKFSAAVTERLGKQRVSIMLDASVIAFFKAKAGERGYQTLINQALHHAMQVEQIANQAKAAGLLTSESIERLVREAIRKVAAERLIEYGKRLREPGDFEITEAELESELKTVRAELRQARARRP